MNHQHNGLAPLPYADSATDAERRFHSLDRTMTARLARVLGICLLFFGVINTILACAGMSDRMPPGLMAIQFLFAAIFAVPGLVLTILSQPVEAGGKASRIAVLILGILVVGILGITLLGAGFEIFTHRDNDAAYVRAVALLVLLIATGKLLYHAIRLILFDELRGERADAIVGVSQLFHPGWLAVSFLEIRRDKTIKVHYQQQFGPDAGDTSFPSGNVDVWIAPDGKMTAAAPLDVDEEFRSRGAEFQSSLARSLHSALYAPTCGVIAGLVGIALSVIVMRKSTGAMEQRRNSPLLAPIVFVPIIIGVIIWMAIGLNGQNFIGPLAMSAIIAGFTPLLLLFNVVLPIAARGAPRRAPIDVG